MTGKPLDAIGPSMGSGMGKADMRPVRDVTATAAVRLLDRIKELESQLEALHGRKFSDRNYNALKSRAETAENEARSLKQAIGEAVRLIHVEDDYDGGMRLLCEAAGLPVNDVETVPTTLYEIMRKAKREDPVIEDGFGGE